MRLRRRLRRLLLQEAGHLGLLRVPLPRAADASACRAVTTAAACSRMLPVSPRTFASSAAIWSLVPASAVMRELM